jgi:L-lactate dehydrogenase (cytochrome)
VTTITHIEDLRLIARRRIPRAIFDYVDSGSYDEITLRANRSELDAVRFRQRVLIDTSKRMMETVLLGEKLSMPVAIAPTGLTGLVHGNGEIHAAKAAEAAGTIYTLSTMSICTIEDVAGALRKPFWFQLYVFRDREFSKSIIARAQAAKCSALFVTVDLPQRGQRHADIKNGLTVPPRLTARNAFDIATKPSWTLKVLLSKRGRLGQQSFRSEFELARHRLDPRPVAGQARPQGHHRPRGRENGGGRGRRRHCRLQSWRPAT